MPVIRISPQVERFLKSKGRFGDSHDSVLRRLLGVGQGPNQGPRQRPQGPPARLQDTAQNAATPPLRYRRLMMRILLNSPGHKIPVGQLLPGVQQRMKSKFTARDKSKTSKNKVLWRSNAEQARKSLLKDGLIHPADQGGRRHWELTPRGVKRAQQISRTTGGAGQQASANVSKG